MKWLSKLLQYGQRLFKAGRGGAIASKSLRIALGPYVQKIVHLLVSPLTKVGTRFSRSLTARTIVLGRQLGRMAQRYPRFGKLFRSLESALTNEKCVSILSQLVVSSAPFVALDVLIDAIASGDSVEMGRVLSSDCVELLEDGDLRAEVLEHLQILRANPDLNSDDRASDLVILSSRDSDIVSRLTAGLKSLITRRKQQPLLDFANSLSTEGYLLALTQLTQAITCFLHASAHSQGVRDLAFVRLQQALAGDIAYPDSLSRQGAMFANKLAEGDDEACAAAATIAGLYASSSHGVYLTLRDMIDKEFNGAWGNIVGFFTSDSKEQSLIAERMEEPEMRLLAAMLGALNSHVDAHATQLSLVVGDSTDDEEMIMAYDALISAFEADCGTELAIESRNCRQLHAAQNGKPQGSFYEAFHD